MHASFIQGVPLATEPDISLIISSIILTIRRTTDTFLFISHTTNVLLFKFRCKVFTGVRIIKEMPGSVASGTHSKKGKAVPLQAWSGPEGSRKLRFPNFMTTAQDGGKVVSLKHRPPLPPRNIPGTHFC